MEDNVGHLSCLEGKSLSWKEKGLSDCVGTLSDTNVGLEKQMHKSDHEVDGCQGEKVADRERICHFSSTGWTKDNADNLKRQSSAISTGNAVPLWICTEKSYFDRSDKNEDSDVSTHLLEGKDSVKKSSMKSSVCSDSGHPIEKEINELVDRKIDGYRLNVGDNELKSAVQTSFRNKQCKSESSSSNSTQLILPASSNDGCEEMLVDKKSCKNIKLSAVDTSTCTDFDLGEPAFRSLVQGMAIHSPKYQLDTTILSSGKQYNVIKDSEPVHNVRTRGSDKVASFSSDDDYVTLENIGHLEYDLPKKKIEEIYKSDGEETLFDLDDALDVAQRVAKEVEQEVEASGSSSSLEGRTSEMVHLSSVDSAYSDREGCLTETGSIQRQCNEQVKSESFSSDKEAVDLKPLTKKEQLCFEGVKLQGMVPGINDGCSFSSSKEAVGLKLLTKKEELCLEEVKLQGKVPGINYGCQRLESSMRHEGLASDDQTSLVLGIDLNEDILENEVEYPEKSVKETAYNHENVSKPIPVVAKSGICLPVPQFQRDGELGGWRGSAATSAFRLTSFSGSCNRNKAFSTNDTIGSSNYSQGIDLNVAADGDYDVELLPKKSIPALSSNHSIESSVEVSSRQARTFDFDLNCVSENDDNCHQLSPPASLSSHSVREFDLNDNPVSADACIGPYIPWDGTRGLRNVVLDDRAVSSVESSRQSDCKSLRSSCSDLSSMEGFSHSHHARSFLVAATNMLPHNEQMQRMAALQHKVSFTQSPPRAFLYNNGFYIDPNNRISSTVYPPSVLPYVTDPHATTAVPQILGSGTLSMFSGPPHFVEVPRGSGPSNFAFIRPTLDLNTGANCLENGSGGIGTRQLSSIPSSKSTVVEEMKSSQEAALTATPMKRREPDGGWDSHQHGFREASCWR